MVRRKQSAASEKRRAVVRDPQGQFQLRALGEYFSAILENPDRRGGVVVPQVQTAQAEIIGLVVPVQLDRLPHFKSRLFGLAIHIVRLAE